MKIPPDVRPGQVWQDMDKRMGYHRLRVVRIDGEHVILENIIRPDLKTRVLIRRMRPGSTGFQLVIPDIHPFPLRPLGGGR